MVVCIVIALAGIISIFSLPVEQYPEVAPPRHRRQHEHEEEEQKEKSPDDGQNQPV